MFERLNLRILKAVFLVVMILAAFAATIFLAAIPVQAALAGQQPVSGPLPPGVIVNSTVSTTASISEAPNPIGVGQVFMVNARVMPEPGSDRTFQGLTVTIVKPDGTRSTIGPLVSSPGMGTAWFQYVPDQVGMWKLKLDFAGMYYPAGRYYNGQIITNSSGGTLYSESVYYTPVSSSELSLAVQAEPIWPGPLQISPSLGPGGATVQFLGSGYPANATVAVSYYDQSVSSWKYWNSVTANSSGGFGFLSEIPDLGRALGTGQQSENWATLSFRTESNGLIYGAANFNEYLRGLNQIGNQTASGLFGNGTSFPSMNILAGDVLTLSGKWFHPGVVYVRWDGSAVVGTVSANEWRNASIIGTGAVNSQGSFEASATIPKASAGLHYIAIEDSQATFIIQVMLSNPSSLQISPSSGPGGVIARFSGSGYPEYATVTISYRDPSSGNWLFMANVTANGSGSINLNVEMPDLQKSAASGDSYGNSYNPLSFMAMCQGIVYSYAEYDEYMRGLTNVGSLTPSGLYGNGTNLSTFYGNGTGAQVKPSDVIPISGRWFHPRDVVYVRWDGVAVVGTVSGSEWRNAIVLNSTITDASGAFTVKITIPDANPGEHYIAVEDSQAKVIVKVLLTLGSLQINPASGPGGTNVQLTGSGYPPSGQVRLSYLDPYDGTWKPWASVNADSSGGIALNFEIPDSQRSLSSGDWPDSSQSYSYRAEVNGIIYGYASYTQYWRGLKKVGSQTASGLFGNGTNFASILKVTAGDTLALSGRWFHPGVLYVRWDGTAVVGTVTADQWRNAVIIGTAVVGASGSFDAAVIIPNATEGEHYIAIEDSQTTLIIKVYAGPANTPEPLPNPEQPPAPQPLTPEINLFCNSTTTISGFKVEIRGDVTANGSAIGGVPVLIQYSTTGGVSWYDLTQVLTSLDGKFIAVWTPPISWTVMIRARCNPTLQMLATSALTNFAVTPAPNQTLFSINSNSTLSTLVFNSTTRELSFAVSGTPGTKGYATIAIPKALMATTSGMTVVIDGNPIGYDATSGTDSWEVNIVYNHSNHSVVIKLAAPPVIPEMPNEAWTACLTVAATVITVTAGIALKKTRKKDP